MRKHLDRYGIISAADPQAFANDYMKMMVDLAIKNPVRVPMPLNLGYIQALEHTYTGHNKEHLRQFGRADYSVVWIKHPMFRYQKIIADKELSEQAREQKKIGGKFLNDYVRGDQYTRKKYEPKQRTKRLPEGVEDNTGGNQPEEGSLPDMC